MHCHWQEVRSKSNLSTVARAQTDSGTDKEKPTSSRTMRSSLSVPRRVRYVEVLFPLETVRGDAVPSVFGTPRHFVQSIMKCDVDSRKELYVNVVLAFTVHHEAGHRHLHGHARPCRVVGWHDNLTAGAKRFLYAECCRGQAFSLWSSRRPVPEDCDVYIRKYVYVNVVLSGGTKISRGLSA